MQSGKSSAENFLAKIDKEPTLIVSTCLLGSGGCHCLGENFSKAKQSDYIGLKISNEEEGKEFPIKVEDLKTSDSIFSTFKAKFKIQSDDSIEKNTDKIKRDTPR